MKKQEPDNNLGLLVHDVSRLMRANFHRRVRPLGPTQAPWRTLFHMSRHEGINQVALAKFSLNVGIWKIVNSGIIQGVGLGCFFVPLSTMTFSTLAPKYRNEASALFNLAHNIGVGIACAVTVLSRNTQISHATLSEHITPFNTLHSSPGATGGWNLSDTAGLIAINNEITRQAASIAYVNDFLFMMFLTLAAIPILFFLKKPPHFPSVAPTA